MSERTIAAISTPLGEGGIGVIRISGDNAISITERFFKPLGKKKLRIGGVRITLVCGDQFILLGFVGVHRVVGALGQALRDGFALVLMHGNDAGCGDIASPPNIMFIFVVICHSQPLLIGFPL